MVGVFFIETLAQESL